jgi:hypothetical protein
VAGKDSGVQIHIDGEKIRLGSDKADKALAIASKVKEELDRICRRKSVFIEINIVQMVLCRRKISLDAFSILGMKQTVIKWTKK